MFYFFKYYQCDPMAARQDVAGATEGGLLALVAGVAAVTVSFALVPVLSRIGNNSSTDKS